ncbi:CopG family transcriptional regulator [Aureimonas phyllosphaerae]|uniref:ribbon-helix-helix domain-containing protein n=1 Tax=Aureimonas phyllosphaerae TaxID=1166078 RepID=UPI003A5BF37D
MADKAQKTMTLNLSVQEMEALERLAQERGMTKTGLVRQALRLYASVTDRLGKGEKVFAENPESKEKAEFLVL